VHWIVLRIRCLRPINIIISDISSGISHIWSIEVLGRLTTFDRSNNFLPATFGANLIDWVKRVMFIEHFTFLFIIDVLSCQIEVLSIEESARLSRALRSLNVRDVDIVSPFDIAKSPVCVWRGSEDVGGLVDLGSFWGIVSAS
jgi:hypothetical protein